MTAPFVIAGSFHLALWVFLLVSGVWAYRRFRLPSIPWLLSYLLLGAVLALPTTHVAKRVVDHAAASGLGPVGSSMTIGEFLASISVTSSALAVVGQALVAWFILAELAFAYQRFAPTDALPAIVSVPRQHSRIVGFALLICAVAMPVFWFALLVARA
jgi:hypothetical protein